MIDWKSLLEKGFTNTAAHGHSVAQQRRLVFQLHTQTHDCTVEDVVRLHMRYSGVGSVGYGPGLDDVQVIPQG